MVVLLGRSASRTPKSRPAHGWFPKTQKIALKATIGTQLLNIQGALQSGTFLFTFVESWRRFNAQTNPGRMLEKLEAKNPTMTAIHVFLGQCTLPSRQNIGSHDEGSERQLKLHFLPQYGPQSKSKT